MKRAFILNGFFIEKRYRKSGIAKALMEAAFEYAEKQDARFIALETGVNNTTAQALYEKMGMMLENDMQRYNYFW